MARPDKKKKERKKERKYQENIVLEKELAPQKVTESLRFWVPLMRGTSLLEFDVLPERKVSHYCNVH